MRECTITWTDDDVRSAEDSMDLNEPLTEDEIDILLRDMQDDHDSSVGINWEVIEQWIHIIIRRRNKITELTKDQFVNLVELYSEEVIEDMDFATLRQCAKEGIAEKWGDYGYGNEVALLESVIETYPHLLEKLNEQN